MSSRTPPSPDCSRPPSSKAPREASRGWFLHLSYLLSSPWSPPCLGWTPRGSLPLGMAHGKMTVFSRESTGVPRVKAGLEAVPAICPSVRCRTLWEAPRLSGDHRELCRVVLGFLSWKGKKGATSRCGGPSGFCCEFRAGWPDSGPAQRSGLLSWEGPDRVLPFPLGHRPATCQGFRSSEHSQASLLPLPTHHALGSVPPFLSQSHVPAAQLLCNLPIDSLPPASSPTGRVPLDSAARKILLKAQLRPHQHATPKPAMVPCTWNPVHAP